VEPLPSALSNHILTAVPGDDFLRDIQTNAHAAVIVGSAGVSAVEALENVVLPFFRNAYAMIPYAYHCLAIDPSMGRTYRSFDFPPCGENFIAFSKRLTSTCSMRSRSASINRGPGD